MVDVSAEIAALKAQIAAITTSQSPVEIAGSIWVVHNPYQRAVWCSKTDCEMMGRKTTYDVVKENKDPEAEDLSLIHI